MADETTPQDCIIIGGGPAGLTAAIYLGRFRRRVLVIDAGESRLRLVPRTRNMPGYPEGVEGPVLQERMRRQAELYGARFVADTVVQVTGDGAFRVRTAREEFTGRAVLLATGVVVTDPPLPGLEAAIQAGLVRYCPICDGYEVQGKTVGVLGASPDSVNEAAFLTTYTRDVIYVPASAAAAPGPEGRRAAVERGIAIETAWAVGLNREEAGVRLTLSDGRTRRVDALYPCLGTRPRSQLIVALGVEVSPKGGVLADRHQETNVRGVFAAGDVLEGLDQIASACGQAAIAAVAIHNRLRD